MVGNLCSLTPATEKPKPRKLNTTQKVDFKRKIQIALFAPSKQLQKSGVAVGWHFTAYDLARSYPGSKQ